MLKRNKYYLLIAFAGTLLAVFWQELNLAYLNHQFPESHGLITSADEASYLRPPQNLLAIGEWKDSSTGIAAHFMRPPGFWTLLSDLKTTFRIFRLVGNESMPNRFCFRRYFTFRPDSWFFELSERRKLIFTSVYALMPCYSGFMYFTITESISPFFMLLTSFYWIKSYRDTASHFPPGFILSGGFLVLIRPQLLIFVLLFITFYALKKRRRLALYSLLVFLPFLGWNMRSVSIAGKWMEFTRFIRKRTIHFIADRTGK